MSLLLEGFILSFIAGLIALGGAVIFNPPSSIVLPVTIGYMLAGFIYPFGVNWIEPSAGGKKG